MWVRSLGQEDSLEEEMATYFSIAWRIPQRSLESSSPWGCRVVHYRATNTVTLKGLTWGFPQPNTEPTEGSNRISNDTRISFLLPDNILLIEVAENGVF